MSHGAARTHVTVLILIDALGWEIVRRFGFCRDLLPHAGVTDTVLGYSSAAIPSLLSGQPPSSHGIWAMYRYDPDGSPFKVFRYLPRLPHALEWRARAATRWALRKRNTIRGYYDLYEIPLDVLGNFDVAHHGDPYQPGGLSRQTLFDDLVGRGVRYRLWNYRTPEASNFSALQDAISGDAEVLFFYTPELDALMHHVGIFHEQVGSKLESYEAQVRALLRRAEQAGKTVSVYLFSDHGMTDVHEVVDLMAAVGEWGYGPGGEVLAFYDSTMARFWCRGETRRGLVERLSATGWGHVVSESELERFGCRFEDCSYGDVIFLLSPGHLIIPSFMGRVPLAAMHGYHPDDRYSKGCFMTNVNRARLPGSILELRNYFLDAIGRGAQ
ncbi:MAG: alkaline phosphatase family protein [Candidatus Krumholzibacteriia bacterium]